MTEIWAGIGQVLVGTMAILVAIFLPMLTYHWGLRNGTRAEVLKGRGKNKFPPCNSCRMLKGRRCEAGNTSDMCGDFSCYKQKKRKA